MRRPGTALLLTVMVMAVLTTTTLGAISIRFDQLNTTDKINSSAVAKSAADAGLFRLKYKLQNQVGALAQSTATDLQTGEEQVVNTQDFKPKPDKMVTTLERSGTQLPKCIAVAVLSPWVNDGQYIYRNATTTNPALIFYYANIINDTSLGTVPGNLDDGANKDTTISTLTNMGHFYNPYAPVGSASKDPNYWLVNVGGPQDEFLTKKAEDGVYSYYKNLDLVYVPYLPRFVDSGILSRTVTSGLALERKTAGELRVMFEDVIKKNNFKVWLDASVAQTNIHQYGFGDLFSDSSEYRINWIQPRLWNDTPELDGASGVYVSRADSLLGGDGNQTIEWEKRELPLLNNADAPNWSLGRSVKILKGTKTFAFVSGTGSQLFSALGGFEAQLFGSLEGIRINQTVRFRMFYAGGTRYTDATVTVVGIRQDSGRIIVKFTKIDSTIRVTLNNITVEPSWQSVNYAALITEPFPSTDRSLPVSGLTDLDTDGSGAGDTTTDGKNISLAFGAGSDCNFANSQNCLAVGDLVDLTSTSGAYAAGQVPVWGKVTSVTHNAAGTSQLSAVVDSLRKGPKPLKNVASTDFIEGGIAKIAYYGGEISNADYDGGYYSELNDLWYYTPSTNVWEYKVATIGALPRLAGAAISYDSTNNRLIIFGGFYHSPYAGGYRPATPDYCYVSKTICRDKNQPGMRMVKNVSNTMYYHPIGSTAMNAVNYANTANLGVGTPYVARVLSTLPQRSGMERWQWNVSRTFTTPISLNLAGNSDQTFSMVLSQTSLAGLSAGDELYISGNLNSGGGYEAWGTLESVNYQTQNIKLRFRGYKVADAQAADQVQVKSINLRVLNRQTAGETCTGQAVVNVCQFLSQESLRGYSVGDLISLEEYTDNETKIRSIFSGYVTGIDINTFRMYFTSNETISGLNDYVNVNYYSAQPSVIKDIPAPVYGAKLSKPVDNKIYLTGGASVNFVQSVYFQPVWVYNIATATWSKPVNILQQPKNPNNPTNSSDPGNYYLRLIKQNVTSQIYLDHFTSAVPVVKDATTTVPDAGDPINGKTIPSWSDSRVWEFLIKTDSTEGNAPAKYFPVLSSQTPITLERRLANGSREVFRGLFEGYEPATNKLKLKHDPRYQSDTGFAAGNGVSATNIKATFFRNNWIGERIQNLDVSGESLTWDSVARRIVMKTTDKTALALPVGAVAMMWRSIGSNQADTGSFIFSVKDRAVTVSGSVYTYTYTTNGPILAAPDPWAYQSTVFNYRVGSQAPPTVITQGGFILTELSPRASTWLYFPDDPNDATDDEPTWHIQNGSNEFRNADINGAPSPRLGYASATFFNGTVSRHVFVGANRGAYATTWELKEATISPRWKWYFRKSPPTSALDLPGLFNGSLSIATVGTEQKAVYFGGKIKTDNSPSDDGRTNGSIYLGIPDSDSFKSTNGRAEDGSTFVVSSQVESYPMLWSISNNHDSTKYADYSKSLTFHTGFKMEGRTGDPCIFIGQRNCYSNLVNLLGRTGRVSGRYKSTYATYNLETWGSSPTVAYKVGTRYLYNDISGTKVRNAVLSASAHNGWHINSHWDQEGYTPYMKDNSDPSGGNDNYDYTDSYNVYNYGTNGTDFDSDKTALFSGFASITGGGAILFTASGVGDAIATNRGSAGRKYSYCAKSDLKKDINGNYVTETLQFFEQNKTSYVCDTAKLGARYMTTLPDNEDVLFMLNASISLASLDTYKIVGYYAGVKRAYSVNARTINSIVTQEIAP